jgi:hypothetical protein
MAAKQKQQKKALVPTTPTPVGSAAPLSPHWAFVVQFRVHPEGGTVSTSGRIEHLVSGRTARFESLDELAAYLARELSRSVHAA